jgi:magnesium transporter
MFIPLVLTLGESVAMQSMTLSLPFLHYGRIPLKRVVRRIITEWKTAVLLGVACILLIALVYLSWYTGYKALWAISLSIFVSILIATTFGSIFPILLHLAKLDPQVASGPVVLMLTDVSVTTIYLYLAQRIL